MIIAHIITDMKTTPKNKVIHSLKIRAFKAIILKDRITYSVEDFRANLLKIEGNLAMTKVRLNKAVKFLKLLKVNTSINTSDSKNSQSDYKKFNSIEKLAKQGNRYLLSLACEKGLTLDVIVETAFPECLDSRCQDLSKAETYELIKKTYTVARNLYYSQGNIVEYS